MGWREKIWSSDNEFDAYCLAEYLDPDWKDHFITPHTAIDMYAEYMDEAKFWKKVKASQ